MIELQTLGPPSCTNAFNKSSLNLPQFVQLMETFVGEEPTLENLKMLVEFVKERYVQMEREKILQLETVNKTKAFCWCCIPMQEESRLLISYIEGCQLSERNPKLR